MRRSCFLLVHFSWRLLGPSGRTRLQEVQEKFLWRGMGIHRKNIQRRQSRKVNSPLWADFFIPLQPARGRNFATRPTACVFRTLGSESCLPAGRNLLRGRNAFPPDPSFQFNSPPEKIKQPNGCFIFRRPGGELNSRIILLQRIALPLGYRAKFFSHCLFLLMLPKELSYFNSLISNCEIPILALLRHPLSQLLQKVLPLFS